MDRQLHNAMMAQYATPSVSGDGRVEWNGGVKCVMPSVKLYGAAVQGALTGKNLFDGQKAIDTATGEQQYRTYFKFQNGETYALSFDSKLSSLSFWFSVSSGSYYGEIDGGQVYFSAVGHLATHFTIPDDGKDYYLCLCSAGAPTASQYLRFFNGEFCDKIQIELGSTATDYEPYCGGIPAPNPSYPIMPVCNDGVYQLTNEDGTWDGGTATAPELWAIPGTDIRDEWDAQTGWGVRRVKKLVLDGTEYFDNKDDVGWRLFVECTSSIICTHFAKSDRQIKNSNTIRAAGDVSLIFYPDFFDSGLEFWKSWLATQYAAGTPVTVWYTPYSPEPFYHPPARLTMPPGYGQIIQVSGSVPDCPITAKYLTHAGGAK